MAASFCATHPHRHSRFVHRQHRWCTVSIGSRNGANRFAAKAGEHEGSQVWVASTADGTRRSTVGTLNMGTWAGTGEALAWDIASDVPSTSPSHGSNSGAQGESYSTHTYAFKRSCPNDSCNEPKASTIIASLARQTIQHRHG